MRLPGEGLKMEKQKNKMFRLNVPMKRGAVLNGVLFRPEERRTADMVMIAITGIHGNF